VLFDLTHVTNTVIATGGGAVLHGTIWKRLKRSGCLVIWLVAEQDVICSRIKNDNQDGTTRPSLSGKDVCNEVGKILAERQPLYQNLVDIMVDTEEMGVDEIVDAIITEINRG
jgi:shikimate kinase